MKDRTEEILLDAKEAKSLFNSRVFAKAVNYVNNGLDDAIINCKFEQPGDADKLILSKQIFNRLLTSIQSYIEEGKTIENKLANELMKERKEKELINPIFNRDVS